jgi:NAD(P)-dependent dehydrogenase (short-subunit alcohol dehydrogenase family)
VINLTETTAIELAPHAIRVNAICPGIIFTPLMHRGDEADAERVMTELQPYPKRGEGADIAGAALWLAGSDSAFVTGTSITVDGGISAAGTRLFGRLNGTTKLDRVAGIAHGTTGQTPTIRRLD